MRVSGKLFHAITIKDYTYNPNAVRRGADYYEQSALRFIDRFDGHLDVRGKDVLDVGCGTGDAAAVFARAGAATSSVSTSTLSRKTPSGFVNATATMSPHASS